MFTEETFSYLQGIREHNTKEWYEAHKEQYKEYVQEPLQTFGEALVESCPPFPDLLHKVSRAFRDPGMPPYTRYRDTMWCYILRYAYFWSEAPVLYFYLSPEGGECGLKVSHPKPKMMEKYREILATEPEEFLALAKELEQEQLEFSGEEYKRLKKGETEETHQFYQRKNLFWKTFLTREELLSGKGLEICKRTIQTLSPMMNYIYTAMYLPVVEAKAAEPPKAEPKMEDSTFTQSNVEEKYGGFMW